MRFGRLAIIAATACSSPSATLVVTTGGESDALTRDPAVTSVLVETVDSTGIRTTLWDGGLTPASTIDLGNPSQQDDVSIQFTGMGAPGPIVFGATPFAELGALSGDVPLFVQRKGELARMPSCLPDGRAAPLLAVTTRAVYVVGGSIPGSQGAPIAACDLLLLNELAAWAPPQSATSFALVQLTQEDADGDLALGVFINANSASVIGLTTQIIECSDDPTISSTACAKADAGAPTIVWATVAGGTTVIGDGTPPTVYVVGPSKTDTASSTIIALPPTIFSMGVLALGSTSPRQGAAVAWAPGRGVFIYGGTASTSYKGAEYIPALTTGSTSLGAPISLEYPPDPATGLAAVAFDADTMLIAGNAAACGADAGSPLVPCKIDLKCTNMCAPVAWGSPLPYALSSPSLFSIGNGAFIIVGDDPSGTTRVFELTASLPAQEIPLKIPRQGARAAQIATGAIVIVGGGSATVESFVP